MGVTYDVLDRDMAAHVGRRIIVEATFDLSYTAGGEALGPGDVRLDTIEGVSVLGSVTGGGYAVGYDAGAGTLRVYEEDAVAGPLAEVAGGTDLSGESVRLEIIGRS